MRQSAGIRKVRRWLSAGFAAITPGRAGRVLAVGAMLAAGTALYFSMNQGEERSSSASGETAQAFQPPVYLGTEDPEWAEAPYDDLSKNFIGIPATGNKSFQEAHAATVLEIWEDDPEEKAYDELLKNFVGIPYKAPNSDAFEIQRLENQINSLLAEASHNPSTDLRQLDREIQRLDHEIDLLLAAGHQ